MLAIIVLHQFFSEVVRRRKMTLLPAISCFFVYQRFFRRASSLTSFFPRSRHRIVASTLSISLPRQHFHNQRRRNALAIALACQTKPTSDNIYMCMCVYSHHAHALRVFCVSCPRVENVALILAGFTAAQHVSLR